MRRIIETIFELFVDKNRNIFEELCNVFKKRAIIQGIDYFVLNQKIL